MSAWASALYSLAEGPHVAGCECLLCCEREMVERCCRAVVAFFWRPLIGDRCAACGGDLPARKGQGRPRRYCHRFACQARRKRGTRALVGAR